MPYSCIPMYTHVYLCIPMYILMYTHACMEYSCQVWNPFTDKDISMLEKVQRRASRWVCGSKWVPHKLAWSKCSDACIRELQWPLLSTRRNYLSVRLLYDIMHHKYPIKFSDFCFFMYQAPLTRYCTI